MDRTVHVVKAGLIVCMLLASANVFAPDLNVPVKSAELLLPTIQRFDQYIDVDYDHSLLNRSFDIDQSINIPINITYWTNAPENLLGNILKNCSLLQIILEGFSGLLWAQKNKRLFGKSMPQQVLQLRIVDVDKIDWADINITQPDIPVDIPQISEVVEFLKMPLDGTTKVKTSLIISPFAEAPAESYSIELEIKCAEMGMLNEIIFRKNIDFTPSFSPKIQINSEKPVRIADPYDAVNFKITVTNTANKKIRVTPQLLNVDSKWSPTINPQFKDIVSGEKDEFVFSIYAPYDFGWHDEVQSFQINFTAAAFPLSEGITIGGPYQISLTVNNHGFSTPGFEFLMIVFAVLLFIILINRRRLK